MEITPESTLTEIGNRDEIADLHNSRHVFMLSNEAPPSYIEASYSRSSVPQIAGDNEYSLGDDAGVTDEQRILSDDDISFSTTASVAPSGKATWRDIILRGIEDSFQDCLPACRASHWPELQEKMQIYPFSVHYAIQALQYIASSALQFAFLTKTINGMDHHSFLAQMQEWTSWSPLQSFARHNSIRGTLMEVLSHVEMIAGIEKDSGLFDFSAWCRVIRHAVDHDIDDMEREIVLLIDSETNLAQSAAELSFEEINTLMDVLQSLIDRQATSHRLFERFLQKLVKASGSLPHYLFLSNVTHVGSHPVSGGGFADVWKGTFGGRIVALKVLRIFGHPSERDRINQEFCKESMIWRQFNHRHVLQFWGVCIDEFSPQLAMVSPWMENGDILTYLKERPNADRKAMVFAIALGLRYLHSLKPKVVHGDLRATNVLIDDEGQPKLADFGLAKVVDSQANSVAASTFNGKGSMRWQAPELLTSSLFPGASLGISTSSDVYAFAAVCLEIFTEDVPFSYLRDGEVVLEVAVKKQTPRRPGRVALERGLDNGLWELMVDCWTTNPCDRPTMEAVAHKLSTAEETPATRSKRDSLHSENYRMEKVDVLTLPGLIAAVRYSRRRKALQYENSYF
ncbi:hypothetical protein M0805_001383 [Coniferiporia weirii]|nr:hypothetical protein M0805_001383 [Coniferiporia weirii]